MDSETMTESDIPIRYSVSEAYISGYMNQVQVLESGTYTEVTWPESTRFINGETYTLKTNNGYLSAVAADKNTLQFVDKATAKNSPLALWKATVSSGVVKLTNQAGQSLNYYASGSTRYFNVITGSTSSQNLTPTEQGAGFRLSYKSGRTNYYLSTTLNNKGYIEAKSQSSSALTVNLMMKTVTSTTLEIDGYGYSITNTPLTTETSLKVVKRWDYPGGDVAFYEKEQVTIRLLANGVDTGRTETVSLKSNWTAVFNGLPYLDEEDNPIVYTVVESWDNEDWIPIYGPVTTTGGDIPTYETTITNTYRWTGSYELPSTGGMGTTIYILCGLILVLGPFVYGFRLRRRYERRSKH
jgi:LPXTG-motif cell wall-anchored protein